KIKIELDIAKNELEKSAQSLTMLEESLKKLKDNYQYLIEDQESDQFFPEFKNELTSLVEEFTELVDEDLLNLVDSFEKVVNTFEDVDEELAQKNGKDL